MFDGENRRLLYISCAWTGFAMKLRHKVAAGVSVFVLGLSVWLAWPAWVWWFKKSGRHEILIILLSIVVVLAYWPKIYLTICNPGDFRRIWFRRPEAKLSDAEIQQRNARKEKVIAQIREAFRGVTLGNGVGLFEGDASDTGASRSMLKPIREKDEKDNWERISVEDLNNCRDSLYFMDAEGMRFHLPACMIAELEGTYHHDIAFHLTDLDDHAKSKLAALSKEQREAVHEFLSYTRNTSRDKSSRDER